MNRELESLILAYGNFSAAKDKVAEQYLLAFEPLLDQVMERHPGPSRDILRKSIINAHRRWALQQDKKPPAIPPNA